MEINLAQKKKWSWKFSNTSKSGTTKKRRHSTLNYQTIEEFNNQNKIYQNAA
jgi:putative transposase